MFGNVPFTQTELKYLKEYVTLMHPLASGLDYLQGDRNTFYGRLIPALFSIKSIFDEMRNQPNTLAIIAIALPQVIKSFEKRFYAQLNLEDSARLAVVAAVSHPEFKLRWANTPEIEDKAREIFITEVNKMASIDSASALPASQSGDGSGSGSFLVLRPASTVSQAFGYLNDPREDLKLLESYPTVKKVFKLSNTPLCSTASLERVFNFAGIINHPNN